MSAPTVMPQAPGQRRTSPAVIRTTLANQADVVANQLDNTAVGSRIRLARVVGVLGGQGIGFVSPPAASPPTGTDQDAVNAVRAAGTTRPPQQPISALGPASPIGTVRGVDYSVEQPKCARKSLGTIAWSIRAGEGAA